MIGWESQKDVVVTNYLQNIKMLSQRVYEIYRHSQLAVESDSFLLSAYRIIYGATTDREDTIKRAGRAWRHNCPDTFQRSMDKLELDRVLEHANKDCWRTLV